jgi:Phosphodiester glycosidase
MPKPHVVRKIIVRSVLIGLVGAVLLSAFYLLWYFNRPLPEAVANQPLFEGVTYTRVVQAEKPLVYHVIYIDLMAEGIAFLTTPADDIDSFDYAARTTGQFLSEFGVQIAINGDFFDPWWSRGVLDYYPHVGDGVNGRGIAMMNSAVVTEGYAPRESFATLYITRDNHVSFSLPDGEIQTAISGNTMVVINGQYNQPLEHSDYLEQRHPRTAIALDESGTTLLLFVVDGRQPSYSQGVSMSELAALIIAQGGYDALNLDGGGSTTLVIEGANGQPQQLGSAIHTRIPYRERPIANHFGVYATLIK